jgi:L-erythro-3,5-diaminohexanoate dehydrogenase
MTSSELVGDKYGAHRVIAPAGSLPQAAERVDNDFERVFDTEILIDVDTLNIDAASFRQISQEVDADLGRIAEHVRQIIATRGKQHNPVTGSGGMLLGRIARLGHAVSTTAKVGDRIATLVSLTLTPLRVDAVRAVRATSAQLDVNGQAVIFASSPFAVMPSDMPERVALAALDVCGAPALVARAVQPSDDVLILGAGGKSGLLCAVEARKQLGAQGRVIGLENHAPAAEELRALDVCDAVIQADARDPLAVRNAVLAANDGREVSVAISCVNVDGAELGAILSTRDRGKVVFFAMSTSFSRAALGAEGAGKDVDLIIGNGYAQGHADLTLDLLRNSSQLRALFERRYG